MNETKKSNYDGITFIVSVALVAITAIVCVSYYNIQDRKLMAQNIETAINKGVDPLSVRCSYASGSDTVCVAYAASHGSQSFSTTKK